MNKIIALCKLKNESDYKNLGYIVEYDASPYRKPIMRPIDCRADRDRHSYEVDTCIGKEIANKDNQLRIGICVNSADMLSKTREDLFELVDSIENLIITSDAASEVIIDININSIEFPNKSDGVGQLIVLEVAFSKKKRVGFDVLSINTDKDYVCPICGTVGIGSSFNFKNEKEVCIDCFITLIFEEE